MPLENQNIEYKESWHDEYLKWICGFANAQGGKIFVGINDAGVVIGIDEAKKLSEDIPNKIREHLGIVCDVNILECNKLSYIEIIVVPYNVPISLRGRYYYRSGSIKCELTGSSLNEFLLKRAGKTWDEIVEERATINDIDFDSVHAFLQMAAKETVCLIRKVYLTNKF